MKSVAWPSKVVGTESLLGISRRYRPVWDGPLTPRESGAPDPDRLLAHRRAGASAVLVAPGEVTDRLLIGLDRSHWSVYGLLPNVPQYVRDSSDFGLMGAAVARVKSASPGALMRLGVTGMLNSGRVLSKDFAGMMCLLLELEAARLQRHRPQAYFLAAAITDLGLSAGYSGMFSHYVKYIHGRFGVPAGLETHNLGHLLRKLREWKTPVDAVIGPVNARGFMMKPTPEEVLSEVRQARCVVLAKEVTAGGTVELSEGLDFANRSGIRSCVMDLEECQDVPLEAGPIRS